MHSIILTSDAGATTIHPFGYLQFSHNNESAYIDSFLFLQVHRSRRHTDLVNFHCDNIWLEKCQKLKGMHNEHTDTKR